MGTLAAALKKIRCHSALPPKSFDPPEKLGPGHDLASARRCLVSVMKRASFVPANLAA